MTQEPEKQPATDGGALAAEVVENSDRNEPKSIWKPALKEAAWAFASAAVLISVTYGLGFKPVSYTHLTLPTT